MACSIATMLKWQLSQAAMMNDICNLMHNQNKLLYMC